VKRHRKTLNKAEVVTGNEIIINIWLFPLSLRLRAEEEDAKRLAEEERVEKRKHFNFQDFAASS
jgi:hypothetical protein